MSRSAGVVAPGWWDALGTRDHVRGDGAGATRSGELVETEARDVARVQLTLRFAAEDAGAGERFRAAFDLMRFDVLTADREATLAPGRPVVALLSDSLAAEYGGVAECTEALASFPGTVIPVALSGKGSPILSDVSQVPLERLGFERSVNRAGLLARSGPEDLKDWNSATATAAEWERGGRPVEMLLTRERASAMLELLNRPVAGLDAERSELARKFAVASTEEADTRDRRLRRVMSISTLVIASLGVIALVAGLISTQLSGIARADGARAEATRLATEATRLIGYDPDLPQVLAARAAQTDSEAPGVAESQWLALQSTVPHASVGLPDDVRSFGARGDHGVLLTDSALIPLEFRTGEKPRLLDGIHKPEVPLESCVPSPTGAEAACYGENGTYVIALRPEQVRDPERMDAPTGTTMLSWIDADTVVAGTDTGVFLRNLRGGAGGWTPLEGGRKEKVYSLDVSATGMDVVYAGAFVSYRFDDLTPVMEVGHDGTFFVDAATTSVTVRTFPDRITVERDGRETPFDGTVSGVVVLAGDTVVTLTPFGELRLMTPAARKSQNVSAHLGRITHAAKLDEHRLVTVGTDGYLREWTPGAETPMGPPPTALETVSGSGLGDASFSFAEGAGSHLASLGGGNPDGNLLLAGYPEGLFATFSVTDAGLTEKVANFLGFGNDMVYLTCDDPELFGVLTDEGTAVYRVAGDSLRPRRAQWIGRPDEEMNAARSTAAMARDCGRVVQADRSALRVWDVVDGEDGTSPAVIDLEEHGEPPVAVLTDGIPAVVLADGTVVHQDGTVVELATPVLGADRRDGRLVAVTDRDEALVVNADGDRRSIPLREGLKPLRVRLGADGTHAAFVGLDFGQIIDLDSGRTVTLLASGSHAPVADVLPDPDSAVILYRDLTVGVVRPGAPTGLVDRLAALVPRPLDDDERERFRLGGER